MAMNFRNRELEAAETAGVNSQLPAPLLTVM